MPDELSLEARAGLIAADYRNGNRSAVRAAIVGSTQQYAVLLALAVLDDLITEASDGNDIAHIIESFSRCIRGY